MFVNIILVFSELYRNVIVTDSIGKYVVNVPDTEVVAFRGYTISQLLEGIKGDSEFFIDFNVWILHVGTNDIGNGGVPERMLHDVKQLVNYIRFLCRSVPFIFISSILPRPCDFSLTNPVIKAYHHLVRDWLKFEPRLQFHKSFSPFFFASLPISKLFTKSDDLHLNWSGTARLRNVFCRILLPFRSRTQSKLPRKLRGNRDLFRRQYSEAPSPAVLSVSHQFRNKMKNSDIHVKGKDDPASNFWSREKYEFRGIAYSSVEQCYQIQKAIVNSTPKNLELYEEITEVSDPKTIKKLGGQMEITVPDWDKRKFIFMYQMLTQKVFQSSAFRDRLYGTGTSRIVHNVGDSFWGSTKFKPGQNKFGELLEMIRDEFIVSS